MIKTNLGLVDYCNAQLGKPYWYGTFGQTAEQWLLDYNKSRFPSTYANPDYQKQLGQRVHDCSGLIKGYMWSDSPDSVPKYGSNGFADMDANTMREMCKARPIGTIEDVPGVLVFAPDHVGVYIGGGEVIEARGHAYGVVKTRLADRGWMWWGYLPNIEYQSITSKTSDKLANVKAWANDNGIADKPLTLSDLIKVLEMMEVAK